MALPPVPDNRQNFQIQHSPAPPQWQASRPSTNHPAEADALAWAQRHGCPTDDLLQILSKISESNRRLEIRPEDIAIGEEIDKGSFGSICRAVHRAQTVVIKRVSEVAHRTCARASRLADIADARPAAHVCSHGQVTLNRSRYTVRLEKRTVQRILYGNM